METENRMRLNDGRTLGYAAYGDPSGIPVFYEHSGSRLDIRATSPVAEAMGVRLIALDRPGVGLSDFRPGYRFLDWPDDVAEAADRLEVNRFAIFGHSLGAVFSLAIAYKLPERVTRCAVIGAPAPPDAPGVMTGMHRGNQVLLSLSRRISWPMRAQAAVMARLVKSSKADRLAQNMLNSLTRPDREVVTNRPELLDDMLDAGRETFRSGTKGAVWANMLYIRPWGFPTQDIRVPVAIWHGREDTNAPVVMAEYLAQAIPGSQLRIMANEGHMSSLMNHIDEILTYLAAPQRAPAVSD